jgi:hemerythrin
MLYPDADRHAAMHDEMVAAMNRLRERLDGSGEGSLPWDQAGFREVFRSWVMDHIFKEDKKFSRHLYSGYAQ